MDQQHEFLWEHFEVFSVSYYSGFSGVMIDMMNRCYHKVMSSQSGTVGAFRLKRPKFTKSDPHAAKHTIGLSGVARDYE